MSLHGDGVYDRVQGYPVMLPDNSRRRIDKEQRVPPTAVVENSYSGLLALGYRLMFPGMKQWVVDHEKKGETWHQYVHNLLRLHSTVRPSQEWRS